MQTLDETRALIRETARDTKCQQTRLSMAKLASGPLSNLSDEGKALWAEYHRQGAPAESESAQ